MQNLINTVRWDYFTKWVENDLIFKIVSSADFF